MRRLHLTIATLGYIGYLPYAPGTFGTLAGLLFISLFTPPDFLLSIILIILSLTGMKSAASAEAEMGRDDPRIVIDEFCGYLLSMLFLPKVLAYLVSAFILFRFFDIFKPSPIKRIETTFEGGIAVMLDDLIAGIYTNICLQLWRLLS